MNVTVNDAVTYRSNLTAHITSVEPVRGGTGGGTNITITGTGFASSGNTVTIAGSICEVQTEKETVIVCKTSAHSRTETAKVRVDVGTGIAVQNNADFFYIDVWSSIYTWNGTNPPVKGDFVIIPEGQTILLDESTPVLKVLLLQGGHMVFDEKDIELHAEYIIITDGGSLTVGTQDEPFQHEATIMLHGHVRTQELPIFGAKVLAVRNGTLDLHGKPVAVTWTNLASTIPPGATNMTLMQPVDWKVGDRIVIAASGHRHAQKESEILSITDISDDNMTLTFAPAVEYTHVSLSQIIDDVVLNTRAEVGLLTRNVKFRGSIHEEWTEQIEACDANFDANQFATQTCFLGRFGEETGSDQFGAHIMLSPKEMNKDLVKGRISYVEVTHAGQAFRLGHYPINFRMSGYITESYVRGCSIYNTFNRALSIQGVHGILVEHNVAYNVMGHAFFLEDGIESGNTFQYNLAVFVRPSSSLLNVDVTPAAYWITNPNNTVRHNAAAGCSHFGFWYNAPVHPKGPSFTSDVHPRKLPLGQFYNNTAHTVGRYGLWIFPVYNPSKPARFDKFSAWEVSRGAKAVKVGKVQFHNFLISDAKNSGLEFKTVTSPWGKNGGYINNSVVIGYSNVNGNNVSEECTSVGVQLPMSKYLTVDGVKFINFDRSQCVAIKACGHCKVYQGGFHTRFQNLKWFNSPNIAAFKWEHECWFEDLDGSLTGNPDYILVPKNDNLPSNHCKFDVVNSSFGEVHGAICDNTVKLHRFAWSLSSPASLLYKNVLLKNKNGESTISFLKARITHRRGWMATLVGGENYTMQFENVGPVTNISYVGRFDEFKEGEYVYMTHNFTQKPDALAVVAGDVRNGTDDISDPFSSNHGDFTFNNNTRQLTYIVTGNGESSPSNKDVDLDVYRCFYKNCVPPVPEPLSETSRRRPKEFRNWSDVESWADAPDGWGGNKGGGKYGLPEDGDNVQIIAGVWMVADIDLPQMNKLYIYGTLEFEDKRDFVVNATYILIYGGRLVAGFSEEKPFTHQLHFILQGTRSTEDIVLPNGSTMGSKVLGVYGHLNLHGVTRKVTWSHLAATALVNSDTIQLVEETGWGKGDEIIVTTTSYETWETETFTIIEKIGQFIFRLNSSFEFNHIANTHELSDNSSKYTLSAEVGLLTRNIIIEGADNDDIFEESFGARVFVGKFNHSGEELTGSAKISNVQFKHTGQAGWTAFEDPHDSLAFLHVGRVTKDFPSYVKGCSFHYCFNTAIGIYGTHGIEVSDNVIHNVAGRGIIIDSGGDDKIIHNLVALIIPKRLKHNKENNPRITKTTITDNLECKFHEDPESLIWNGGIEVVKAKRPVLINNTVAGSERVGYKVRGEPCSERSDSSAKWYGNVAHSTLHGIHLKDDSKHGCSMVSNFFIWNSFDYGVYAQIPSSLSVADSVLVDNKVGIFALIVGPPAIQHKTSDKFVEVKDSVLVGTSPSYDCHADSPKAAMDTEIHRNQLSPGEGNVGFFFAVFMSLRNGAYFRSLSGVKSYPTIRGISKLTGVKFSDYGNACGKKHVTIMTNPASSDASHPVHVQNLSFVDVPEENFVWIHRPNIEYAFITFILVNPSDCVDMDCDGMKKAIIRDLDGSMLGDVGTVIPQSEFEWNGDHRRGLGDHRIPETMLTKPDGSRISVPPNKGIYRGNNDCKRVDDWQAYKCRNLDHMMMVVESMDADTEIRRVSPVSLSSNGYVDLINGPRDYGCCYGYTCQERISTFYTIVATGRYYELHFTGTTPQKLRYHLLNANDTQSVVVSTYYSNPQRFDVYVNGTYITPTNGVTENGFFTWKEPEADKTNSDYYSSLNSGDLGSNFFDRDLGQLFVLIRGPTVIEVVTTSIIMVTFGIPAVEVDKFFEENLVQNLASFLDIPPSKIRVVKIISEDSARRSRRSAEEVHVEVEIGNQPSATSSSDVSSTNAVKPGAVSYDDRRLSFDNLLEIQSKIVNEYQAEGLARAFNFQVTYLSMTDPVDSPVDPTGGVRATIETGGTPRDTGPTYAEKQAREEVNKTKLSAPVVYRQPSELIIAQEPGKATKGDPFLTQPKIKMVDAVGNIVKQSGHASKPWVLEVALRGKAVSETTSLSGVTTYSFTNGWVNFTNLAINTNGTGFILDFTVIYPITSSLSTNSAEFEVKAPASRPPEDDEDDRVSDSRDGIYDNDYDDFIYLNGPIDSNSYSVDVTDTTCKGRDQPSVPLGPGTDEERVDSDSISYIDVKPGDLGVDGDSISYNDVLSDVGDRTAQPSVPLAPGTDEERVDSDSYSYNDVKPGDPGVDSDSYSYNDVTGDVGDGTAQPSVPLAPGTDEEGVDSDSISYNDVKPGDPGVDSDSYSYNDVIGDVGDGTAQPSVPLAPGTDEKRVDSDSISYNDIKAGDPGVDSDSYSYNDVIGDVGDGTAQPSVPLAPGTDEKRVDSDSYSYNYVKRGDHSVDSDSYSYDDVIGKVEDGGVQPSAPNGQRGGIAIDDSDSYSEDRSGRVRRRADSRREKNTIYYRTE
ncbi:Fibrocystin-L [Holothuria leucospilota]|uniref:Fibrocystin-L n=1 Tax=Holothuria leucospilota TaxID=206669 RepID=A0A9Q1BFT5_HOLLE|nr:Fibrocystin-L [Holothuria leucospilota]